MIEAAKRLGTRVGDLKSLEKARGQRAVHERVLAERDRLAAELEGMVDPIVKIAHIVAKIDACDREIRRVNSEGSHLGYIRPVLSGAAPAITALLGDAVVRDSLIAIARL